MCSRVCVRSQARVGVPELSLFRNTVCLVFQSLSLDWNSPSRLCSLTIQETPRSAICLLLLGLRFQTHHCLGLAGCCSVVVIATVAVVTVVVVIVAVFLHLFWGSNSGPCACKVNTLPTEPFLQPPSRSLFRRNTFFPFSSHYF